MSAAETRAGKERVDRLVLAQAHCSALDLGAAALFYLVADRLPRVPGAWGGWRVPILASAALATAAALGPWLVPRFSVRLQRVLVWSAVAVGAAGVLGATWEVDVLAYLALQLLLASGVLAELGTQRRALQWFWMTAIVIVAAFVVYHGVVDIQPRPE